MCGTRLVHSSVDHYLRKFIRYKYKTIVGVVSKKKNLKEEILLSAGPVRYSRGKLASSVTRGVSWPRWLLEGEVYLDLKVKVLHRHIDKARSRPLSCTRFSGSSDADGDAPSLLQILK